MLTLFYLLSNFSCICNSLVLVFPCSSFVLNHNRNPCSKIIKIVGRGSYKLNTYKGILTIKYKRKIKY